MDKHLLLEMASTLNDSDSLISSRTDDKASSENIESSDGDNGKRKWKTRKPRGSRACLVCRLRKVRCDAESQMPCTNCITFGCDCKIPESRRKRNNKVIPSKSSASTVELPAYAHNFQPQELPNNQQFHTLQQHVQPFHQQQFSQQEQPYPIQQFAPIQAQQQYHQQIPMQAPPQNFQQPPYPHYQVLQSYPYQQQQFNRTENQVTQPAHIYDQHLTSNIIANNNLNNNDASNQDKMHIPNKNDYIYQNKLPYIPTKEETYIQPQELGTHHEVGGFLHPDMNPNTPTSKPLLPASSHTYPSFSGQVKSEIPIASIQPNLQSNENNPVPQTLPFVKQESYSPQLKDEPIKPQQKPTPFLPPHVAVPGPRLPGILINNDNGYSAHTEENDTTFVPNEPILNISAINVTPFFDPSDLETKHTVANGIKITQSRHLSEFTYFGPTSCYFYFANGELLDDWIDGDQQSDESKEDSPSEDEKNFKYQSYSNIDANEVLSELSILNIKQAFYLPSKHISSIIYEAFFEHVYPQVPIINKEGFLRHVNDPNPNKRPPLILMQAMLLAGSRFCSHPSILDADGKNSATSQILYNRAKALYDSSLRFEYVGDLLTEDDGQLIFNYPTVLVQVLSLLSWYWEGPADVNRGPFYWIKNAITLSQSFGFHRNAEKTHLIKIMYKKFRGSRKVTKFKVYQQIYYWKKMWWFLCNRDRGISLSFGRPIATDTDDCDVAMINLEDYSLYESNWDINNEEQKLQAEFFIALTQLSELVGITIKEEYSVGLGSKLTSFKRHIKIVKQCNLIAGYYYTNLPENLIFNNHNSKSMNFYSSLIGSLYFILLYHINRVKFASVTNENNKYWGISFQSVYMSSIIGQYLNEQVENGSLKLLPTLVIYIMALTMILLSFHTDSSNKIVAKTASKQVRACLNFLRQTHETWPGLSYMLITFFSERLNSHNTKSSYMVKAKKMLFDVCREYQINEEKLSRDSNKTIDINFLLNNNDKKKKTLEGDSEDEVGAEPKSNKNKHNINNNRINSYNNSEDDLTENWDIKDDLDDITLPIFNTKTIKLPHYDSDFYKTFDISHLFPRNNANKQYNLQRSATSNTLGPSNVAVVNTMQTDNTTNNGTLAYYDSLSGYNGSSNDGSIMFNKANDSDTNNDIRHNNHGDQYPNTVYCTPVTAASTILLNNIDSSNVDDNATPAMAHDDTHSRSQPDSVESDILLDTQYFLNVDSGVDWNTFSI